MGHHPLLGDKSKMSHLLINNVENSSFERPDVFGFKLQSGQTKRNKIYIYCFLTKHTTLRSQSKDWLVLNQDNVSECSDMFSV